MARFKFVRVPGHPTWVNVDLILRIERYDYRGSYRIRLWYGPCILTEPAKFDEYVFTSKTDRDDFLEALKS